MLLVIVIVIVVRFVRGIGLVDIDFVVIVSELPLLLFLGKRRKHHENVAIVQFRLEIDMSDPGEVLLDLLHQFEAEFLVRHLTTTELQLDADFEAVHEEVLRVHEFDLVVVLADARTEFHLFLALLRFFRLLLLRLFVLVLPVVDDTTNRRSCVRCDLDKVETEFLRLLQSLVRGNHDVVFAVDHADLGSSDAFVHPRPRSPRPAFHGSLSYGSSPSVV